jgi:PAS domain S-box-containing protein
MTKVAPAVRRMASTVMRYGLAVLCVVAALLVTELLQYFLDGPPWFVFLAAVVISSWVAGLGPGLLAVLLSTLAIDYFFVPPLYILSLKIEYLPRLVVFGVSALLVGWLSDRRKRAEAALRRARDELEAKVQERTAELTRTNERLQAEIAERTRAEEERGQLLAREQAAHAEAVAAQHRFRDLVNSIEGIVWEADAQTFQFLFVSQQAQRVLGYPVERWLSEPTFWKDHIHPDDRERAVEFCVAATAEKRDHEFEYRMLAADGRSVWLRDLVTVVAEGGRATRLRGVMIDITARRQAEEALRERANLLDLTHDTVFVRDMGDVITYWNRGAEELYGWKKEEAVGQVSHRLMQTIFPAPLEAIIAELLGTGRWEGELTHTKRDGTQVVVASRWSLQRNERGTPIAILETNNDITERRRAEEALRESEEQWRAVFENNPTMYFMVDTAGTILSVNPFGAEQLGYTVDELVGHSVLHVFYEADREAVLRNAAVCLEQLGRTMSWELRKVRKDGTVLWVRETAKAVLMKNRLVVLIVCEDITERKRAEEELEKTEQRLRAVIANAPIILFALDRSGVFTLSEGRGLDALGLKPGQVVGQSVFEVYRDVPQVLSNIRRALAGEPFTEFVEVNNLVFETYYIPFLDKQGEVAGVNGVAMNITERRRAEEELRESERRYRNIFETAGVSIWEEDFSQVKAAIDELKARGVRDFRGYLAAHPEFVRQAISLVKIIDVNDATVKLFGAGSKDELLVSLQAIFTPETQEVFAGELVAIAEGQTVFESETVLQNLQGDKLAVLFTMTFPPQPATLDSVLVSMMDITERKRAEYLTGQVFETSPDGKSIVGRDYRYQRVNPVYERIWGMPAERIVGMHVADLLGMEVFEQTVKPHLDRCFAGEDVTYGEWFANPLGRRYMAVSYTPLRPDSERVEAALVIGRDLTEHMLASEALREAQMDLAHVTRALTLGEITASIAHEVNQPLAGVTTNGNAGLRWLAREPPNLEEARECLRRIIRDGNRASDVIARIRALVKKSAPAKARLDLSETIQEVLAIIDTEARQHRVSVRTELAAGLPPVRGDRVQLQQVLLNLVMNGIDAMKAVTDRPRVLRIRAQTHESGQVLVAVQDAGIGLDPQSIERLFEPFYTTKPEGMGMGLSISRSIIEAHGGRLWASPNVGPGVTVQFTLPTGDAGAS